MPEKKKSRPKAADIARQVAEEAFAPPRRRASLVRTPTAAPVDLGPGDAAAAGPSAKPEGFRFLDTYTDTELIELRHEVSARLPDLTLASMNLEEELLLQFFAAKALSASISGDLGTPANQKAQVLNSCAGVLDQIIKMQTQLYNAERLKVLEQCLDRAFNGAAAHIKEDFFARYTAEIGRAGDTKQAQKDARKA